MISGWTKGNYVIRKVILYASLQENRRNMNSSVGAVIRLWVGQSRNAYSILGRDKSFPAS